MDDVIITLDNAPIHRSMSSKAWATKLRFRLEWLPPYTPKLAPVMLVFGMTKTIIARQRNVKAIDFSRSTGLIWLKDSLSTLTNTQVKLLWINVINEAKLVITPALDQAKRYDILDKTNNKQNKVEN